MFLGQTEFETPMLGNTLDERLIDRRVIQKSMRFTQWQPICRTPRKAQSLNLLASSVFNSGLSRRAIKTCICRRTFASLARSFFVELPIIK